MRHEVAETPRQGRPASRDAGVTACREWCCQGGSLRLARSLPPSSRCRAPAASSATPSAPDAVKSAGQELEVDFPPSVRESRARPSLLKGWSRR